MKKFNAVFLLAIIALVCMDTVQGGEGNTVVLSVECKNTLRSGGMAKLNPAFEDTHEKWLIYCPNASATKVSESSTGAQWRIKPIKKEIGKVLIQYRDEFEQQHQVVATADPADSSMEVTVRRMVNRLQIGRVGSRVTAVYFAKAGKKGSLSDEDKCMSSGPGSYHFPAVWQGPQKAWSLYLKTVSGVTEIPAGGNFFGLWGDFDYSDVGGSESFTAKSNCKKLNSN